MTFELTLTARQVGGANVKQFYRRFTVTNNAGTFTVVGTTSQDLGTPTWSVAIATDTLGPVVRVTGDANTIDWVGRVRVLNRISN